MVTKYCEENETALKEKEMREKWLTLTPYPALKKLLAGKDPWNYTQDQFVKMLEEQEIKITVKEAGMLLDKLRDEKCRENGEY